MAPAAPVFENSTACERREPLTLTQVGGFNLVVSSELGSEGTSFEHKLKVNQAVNSGRERSSRPEYDNHLHGEFDPGSGRTLAARLTHASRARTRASALGTAANG